MLYRVIGASGSGKTEYIMSKLGDALKKGKRCFVIVPEQQSVTYESMLCERFGDSVNLLCEVLNFERLPNRIARDFGGLSVNNIDKGGACALLSLVAESLKGQLKEYSVVASDPDFAQSMLSLIARMKMALISPDTIINALGEGTLEDNRLSAKLHDISLIYSEYEKCFSDNLCDPRDALTRLSQELPNKPFFKNSCVFIDNYYTFTEQEYAVVKEIIEQSAEAYISFTVDNNRSFFDENDKCAYRVKKLASGNCEDYYTGESRRTDKKSLRYLERNLWKTSPDALNIDDGGIKLITAKNRFDEVEAAAAEIMKYVREGGRYRDITVLTGNVNAYSSIVDSVFSRADIPCYMSAKEELQNQPLFAFLLSCLSVVNEDFSLRSMKRYIKSGYTELTVGESDALLNYAHAWNLRGKAWYGDDDWTLDPEGYREGDLTPRGAKLLEIANKARQKVVSSLSALRDTLNKKGLTVSIGVRALYEHLISMSADEKLRLSAERALNQGERERSEREIQLWKILINIFDQLDSICGDREVTPKRLASLIKLMCACYSLGAIPASADSVTFGDASLIRAGNSKLVIVLGVCDGEFPSSASASAFFDRDEAVELEEVGLSLADTMEKQLNTNRFFVYSAFSAPVQKLVLTLPRGELKGEELRPSSAWLSVKQMFPELKENEFSPETELYSVESVAANFPSLAEGEIRDSIEKTLSDKNISFFREHPEVTETESKIEFDKDTLLLSPSRFERYVLCPFSFFGNYLLDLKEKKKNEFSTPEMGNFAHKILEQFMRECVSSGSFVRPDDEARKNLVEVLTKKYFLDVIGNNAQDDKRFMHIYSNMVKTIDFVAESLASEFSESKFKPSGFEFKIGLGEEDIPAIRYDVEGKKVLLRGSIDRVDTYESNGVTYVRVIDYKTYNKEFSVNLVAHGMDTQLLHYLFAFCEKTNSKPAGAFYYSVSLPNVKISGNESESEIKEMVEKTIKRSGVLLDNSDVVYAMSPDLKFVPVTSNKDGSLRRSSRLLDEAGFDALSESLKSQVETLARDVFCGNMDVIPNDIEGKKDPCQFCSLGDLCRNRKNKEVTDEPDTETD